MSYAALRIADRPGNRARRYRLARELILFGSVYLLYDIARWLFAGDPTQAVVHARWIVALERSANVAVEASIQLALASGVVGWLMANVYLTARLVITPVVLVCPSAVRRQCR